MAGWKWERNAYREFREAQASASGRPLLGEVASVLNRLYYGDFQKIEMVPGRLWVAPVFTESEWSIIFGQSRGVLLLVHLVEASWRDLPQSAIDLAEKRLDDPDVR